MYYAKYNQPIKFTSSIFAQFFSLLIVKKLVLKTSISYEFQSAYYNTL